MTGWTPAALHRRLLTIGLLGLGVGLVFARPAAVVLGAAALWWALAAERRRPQVTRQPADVELLVRPDRCLEGDTVEVGAVVEVDADAVIDATLRHAPTVRVEATESRALFGAGRHELHWTVRATHWGRVPVGPLVLDVRSPGLLERCRMVVPARVLAVLPAAQTVRQLPLPRTLPNRLGDHVSRAVGDGTEFAGVRPLVAGDSLRRVNRRASARYGQVFVNTYQAERACDLVVAVDGFSDLGPAGSSSLDSSVRGATRLAHSYLADHDRVGLVTIGGILRWVGVDSGSTQIHRIGEALLDVLDSVSVVAPAIERLPRVALPAGCLVVMFSPLVDERAIGVAHDLRGRGLPVVVVDVLTAGPFVRAKSRPSQLALRWWALERQATRTKLQAAGVHVVSWNGRDALDVALARLGLRRLA